jgi:hypothetical protein
MLIKHGKLDFAIGVSWHLSQDKNDVRALLKEHSNQSKLTVNIDGNTWVAFGNDTAAYAAALVIAQIYPDIIIAEQLENNKVWLCAINKGAPAPGRDIIIDAGEMRELIMEWMNYFPASMVYGDIEGSRGTSAELWEIILAAIDQKQIDKKQLSSFKLQLGLSPKRVKKTMFIIVAVIVFGMPMWYLLKPTAVSIVQAQQREEQKRQQEVLRLAEIEKQKQIALQVKEMKAKIVAIKNNIVAAQHASYLDSWLGHYKSLPTSFRGYKPVTVKCTASTCDTVWRAMGKTLAADRSKLPGHQSAPAKSPQQPIVTNNLGDFSEEIVSDVLLQKIGATCNTRAFMPYKMLRPQLIDAMGTSKSTFTMASPVPVTVTGVPAGGVPDEIVTYKGEMQIQVNGFSAMNEIRSAADIFNHFCQFGLAVEWHDITILPQLNGDSITAKIDYYISN